jgi:hypothetical protein
VAQTDPAAGQSLAVEFNDDVKHLQQIQQLEKRLFAKSDGWRGGVAVQWRSHFPGTLAAASAMQHQCRKLSMPSFLALPEGGCGTRLGGA